MAIKKQSEKDFLGSACFTPDCYGVIMKIQMLDCNKTKTFEGKNKGQQSGVEKYVVEHKSGEGGHLF